MIILLHGPDAYRRKDKKDFYIREFGKKHSPEGIGRFDVSENGAWEACMAFLKNQSMFEPVKFAVIEGLYATPEGQAKEVLISARESKSVNILVSEEKKPPRALAFLSKTPVTVREFPYLKGAEWKRFVQSKAQELGVALSSSAAELLSDVYEKDTWRLVTLLDTAQSLKKEIGTKELGILGVESAPDAWRTLTALKSAAVRTRLSALQILSSQNEPATKTFFILSSLWQERAEAFAAHDILVKSGKMDYDEALLDLAVA